MSTIKRIFERTKGSIVFNREDTKVIMMSRIEKDTGFPCLKFQSDVIVVGDTSYYPSREFSDWIKLDPENRTNDVEVLLLYNTKRAEIIGHLD